MIAEQNYEDLYENQRNKTALIVVLLLATAVLTLFVGYFGGKQDCLNKSYDTFLAEHCGEGTEPVCLSSDKIDYIDHMNELFFFENKFT